MEAITSKKEMLERLKDIHLVEVMARDKYNEDIKNFKKKEIVKVIKIIRNDEDIHIALLEGLIKMLEEAE